MGTHPSGGHPHRGGTGAWTVVAVILVILLVLALIWAIGVGFAPFEEQPALVPPDVAGPVRGTEGTVPDYAETATVETPPAETPGGGMPPR